MVSTRDETAGSRSKGQRLRVVGHHVGVDPRPLTERENEILAFLLSAEFPDVEKLRRQAQTAQVIGRCECGCATVYLRVDESMPTADEVGQSNAVDAAGRPTADDGPPPELILFVKGGRLSSIEIVWYGEAPIGEFPPPDAFERPIALWLNGGHGSYS
jgi:hypothetical protein